ncbi:MAG TPA: response regulator, partial [Flavisolibacter sp.]|nr:response regulator [Flavisolibacter sp.]
MNVIIIEDEVACASVLKQELAEIASTIEVVAVIPSIKEAVSFFTDYSLPIDLIFMDIKLTDGYAFEIFKNVTIIQPVIVVTAYNEYILRALKMNSVDFLLKPINREELRNALKKIQNLKT